MRFVLIQGWAQGWRNGDSIRLPPMWPGFDSQNRRHMWVEFVGSLLCTERLCSGYSGYSGFPLSSKTSTWLELRKLLISVYSVPISAPAPAWLLFKSLVTKHRTVKWYMYIVHIQLIDPWQWQLIDFTMSNARRFYLSMGGRRREFEMWMR